MKVSELISLLQKDNQPDDEIIVLWWGKRDFDYDEEDEMVLTDSAWAEIAKEFDEWDNADAQVVDWINDAVVEKAEINNNIATS